MRDACCVRVVPLHRAGLRHIVMTEGPTMQLWWSTIISSPSRTSVAATIGELQRHRGADKGDSPTRAATRPRARPRPAGPISVCPLDGSVLFDESSAAVGRAGPSDRSARAARARLRLVHRGLRHRRSERRQGAAGRAHGVAEYACILTASSAAKVRNRRVSPVAPRPSKGPLTEPTAGAQPWPWERAPMPQRRH
jgi:hypothetical protein